MNWLSVLKGKRTYILMLVIVLQAVYGFVDGGLTLSEAVNQALMGLGLGTLRAGVSK